MKKTKRNFIGGEWLEGANAADNINPSDTSDIIGEYAHASAAQTEQAIDAAYQASSAWGNSSIQNRSEILDNIGSEILRRKDELGELVSREEGKTLPEGIGEAMRAGQVFKFFAGEALRLGGEFIDSIRPGLDVSVTRAPVGVVGLILPWNFPIAIPAWKVAPALAYGNAVVFKPAELVPATAHAMSEIIVNAGVPDGVFNLVMGRGSEVGETIVNHSMVNAISFTGSVRTGRGVAIAAASRMAKVQLEMGGKNPLVVLDDADLSKAVECAINGAYFSTGQRCTASSRLIVTEGIHDKFVAALSKRMESLTVDHALKAVTDIGPVVDQRQLQQNLDYIKVGINDGANLVCGGEQVSRDTQGFYMTPALFTESNNKMRINREEVFGPVATVIRVKDYDEALATANDTEFGLSSGIVTKSLKYSSGIFSLV
jgi:aldehyde dehydrogenase (NAD+)